MKSIIYFVRVFTLVIALLVSVTELNAQDYGYSYDGGAQLPSSATYNEIQQNYGYPSLRADGVDEPELGGIDAPDPNAPIGDGLYPLIAAGLGYILFLYFRNKHRIIDENTDSGQ